MKKIEKVVLAYSGGLDTSVMIPWLKENYNNCEVIAVTGNVGQGEEELEGLEYDAVKNVCAALCSDSFQEYLEEKERIIKGSCCFCRCRQVK